MDKYIYTNKYSLSESLCIDTIQWFENNENKRVGMTISGINKNVKDTTDIMLNNSNYPELYNLLVKELKYNIHKYIKNLFTDDYLNDNLSKKYEILPNNFTVPVIMIQKYKKNEGKYIYHSDFCINKNIFRVITFIWYLNDVIEGGQTVFNGDLKIQPEMGKLVLFPATWTYPHCGKMPISSDKYIITGWVYINNINE